MKTSETINEISAALAKAQASMNNASMNKVNPHFKSKYADLAEIRNTVTPQLAANGIAVIQGTDATSDGFFVFTKLVHSSGQWIESRYPIIADTNKPQAMGSAMTYARRYLLSAMCNIASEEDDDGNEAADHGKQAPEIRNMPGQPGASKKDARTDFEYLAQEMRKAQTVEAMKNWKELRKREINALPPDWVDQLGQIYSEHKDGLAATVDGSRL